MKTICFILIASMLTTMKSVAQQSAEKTDYLIKAEKYRKMKNTGAALTILGGVLVCVGVVTMNSSSYNMWTGEGEGSMQAGALSTVFGIAGLGSGIPLCAVGSHNHRKYSEKANAISVRVNTSSRSAGLTLSYRF